MNNNIEFNEFSNRSENILPRTKFLVSVGYLFLQSIIPGLVILFLTGTDFTFSFKLPFWLMFLLMLVGILVTVCLTFLGYKLKLHQIDQFTYTIPFAFVIAMLYITGCWFSPSQILIRFIIAIAGAVIGIFLTSIILLLVIRKKHLK